MTEGTRNEPVEEISQEKPEIQEAQAELNKATHEAPSKVEDLNIPDAEKVQEEFTSAVNAVVESTAMAEADRGTMTEDGTEGAAALGDPNQAEQQAQETEFIAGAVEELSSIVGEELHDANEQYKMSLELMREVSQRQSETAENVTRPSAPPEGSPGGEGGITEETVVENTESEADSTDSENDDAPDKEPPPLPGSSDANGSLNIFPDPTDWDESNETADLEEFLAAGDMVTSVGGGSTITGGQSRGVGEAQVPDDSDYSASDQAVKTNSDSAISPSLHASATFREQPDSPTDLWEPDNTNSDESDYLSGVNDILGNLQDKSDDLVTKTDQVREAPETSPTDDDQLEGHDQNSTVPEVNSNTLTADLTRVTGEKGSIQIEAISANEGSSPDKTTSGKSFDDVEVSGLNKAADAVMSAGQLATPSIPGGSVLSAAMGGGEQGGSTDSNNEGSDQPQPPLLSDYTTTTTDDGGNEVVTVDHEAFDAAMAEYVALLSGAEQDKIGQETSDSNAEIQEAIDELQEKKTELLKMVARLNYEIQLIDDPDRFPPPFGLGKTQVTWLTLIENSDGTFAFGIDGGYAQGGPDWSSEIDSLRNEGIAAMQKGKNILGQAINEIDAAIAALQESSNTEE